MQNQKQGIAYRQEHRQTMKLAPRQLHSLNMLAMSLPQLRAEIAREISENPAKEDVDRPLETQLSCFAAQLEAAKQLNNVLAAISENLREQKEIDIPSFGRFYIKRVEERQGINPATKQQITIPAHDKVVFKPYKPMLYYAEKY